jgi:hypothetical protein
LTFISLQAVKDFQVLLNYYASDVSIIALEGYKKGSQKDVHPRAELERLQVRNVFASCLELGASICIAVASRRESFEPSNLGTSKTWQQQNYLHPCLSSIESLTVNSLFNKLQFCFSQKLDARIIIGEFSIYRAVDIFCEVGIWLFISFSFISK